MDRVALAQQKPVSLSVAVLQLQEVKEQSRHQIGTRHGTPEMAELGACD
jgi:hypothetical protein